MSCHALCTTPKLGPCILTFFILLISFIWNVPMPSKAYTSRHNSNTTALVKAEVLAWATIR
jgi:hypothetical protein